MVPDSLLKWVKEARTIAVVGVVHKEGRASLRIYRFLKEKGYKVFPVNPLYEEVAQLAQDSGIPVVMDTCIYKAFMAL